MVTLCMVSLSFFRNLTSKLKLSGIDIKNYMLNKADFFEKLVRFEPAVIDGLYSYVFFF